MPKKDQKTLSILKFGGSLLENDAYIEKLARFVSGLDGDKIIVHGGGNKTSEISARLGTEPRMIDGRRVTDAAALDVATMVYAGLYNKKVVSLFQKHGILSLGMSGADLNSIQSRKRPVKSIDYGYVGDIDHVNVLALRMILKLGVTPVFCAITHDNNGQLLNTNADTIATLIATHMTKKYRHIRLLYCMEKDGVMMDPDDPETLIESLDYAAYQQLKMESVITLGMIPKLDNAFYALINGVGEVWVTGLDRLGEPQNIKGTRIIE